MPRGFPAFPCPAEKINRLGTNYAKSRRSTYMRRGPRRRMSPFNSSGRTTVQQISHKVRFRRGPCIPSSPYVCLHLYFKPLLALVLLVLNEKAPQSNRKSRIVSAASAAAMVSAESCPAGSRSYTQMTPRSPPSASCPLPAPVRTGPCSSGGCAYRNPSDPE
jgi:hypothetical protein